jgi:hypothetical protein
MFNLKQKINMETKVQGQDVSPNEAKRVLPAVYPLIDNHRWYADLSLKSLLDTSDEAKLGNIKFMIELIKNQITIENYDKK